MKPVPVAVIPQLYDFVTWTSAKIATYPRAHRFTVGDRLMAGMLDALDRLIEAQYSPATRQVALQQANASSSACAISCGCPRTSTASPSRSTSMPVTACWGSARWWADGRGIRPRDSHRRCQHETVVSTP